MRPTGGMCNEQQQRRSDQRRCDPPAARSTGGKTSRGQDERIARLIRGKTNEWQDERAARPTGSMCNEQQRNGGVTNGGVIHWQRDKLAAKPTEARRTAAKINGR
ncbi:hypothetical protein Ae201684P_009028 [Aphanomyces euteiches]|nr:hypothetical protein Ae201684P_009028 [Aphanomyces euteiches]